MGHLRDKGLAGERCESPLKLAVGPHDAEVNSTSVLLGHNLTRNRSIPIILQQYEARRTPESLMIL